MAGSQFGGWQGGQMVQCSILVWFWLEPLWDSQAQLLFLKKWKDA